MRIAPALLGLCVAASCGGHGGNVSPDAAVAKDSPGGGGSDGPLFDAPPDAELDAACEHTLLVGGQDVMAQGWVQHIQPNAVLSYGADYTQLVTSTDSGAFSGGQYLLSYADAYPIGQPFALEVVIAVVSVSPHDQFDAAAAIMGAFTPSVGVQSERAEMIYLDAARVGWADDTQSAVEAVTDGQYHTVVLRVDSTSNATVSYDGTPVLARAGYVANGRIAVGDQTNDPNVDATTRIKSVRMLCP